jgi:hypothetical protein
MAGWPKSEHLFLFAAAGGGGSRLAGPGMRLVYGLRRTASLGRGCRLSLQRGHFRSTTV